MVNCFKIGAEAMNCRTAAVAFNLSSFCKLLVEGPDAKQALEWICTSDINQPANTYVVANFLFYFLFEFQFYHMLKFAMLGQRIRVH